MERGVRVMILTEIFELIVRYSIIGTIAGLVVLGIGKIVNHIRVPRWIVLCLWGVIGLRLICPFSIESKLSIFNWSHHASKIEQIMSVTQDEMGEVYVISDERILYDNSVMQTEMIQENENKEQLTNGSESKSTERNVQIKNQMQNDFTNQNVIQMIAKLWLGGMIGLWIWAAVAYIRLRYRLQFAMKLSDGIYETDAITSPCVVGFIRPKIYTIPNLTKKQLEHIILHEQMHIRYKDYVWKLLSFGVLSIHWFNPFVWIFYKVFQGEVEKACDERVIKRIGEEQKEDYSESLLALARERVWKLPAPIAFGADDTKARIQTILAYRKSLITVTILIALFGVVACGALMTEAPVNVSDEQLAVQDWDLMIKQELVKLYSISDEVSIVDTFQLENQVVVHYRTKRNYYGHAVFREYDGEWEREVPEPVNGQGADTQYIYLRNVWLQKEGNEVMYDLILHNSENVCTVERITEDEIITLTGQEGTYMTLLEAEEGEIGGIKWNLLDKDRRIVAQTQKTVEDKVYEELNDNGVIYQARRGGIYRIADNQEERIFDQYAGMNPRMFVYGERLYFITDGAYYDGALDWMDSTVRFVDLKTGEWGDLKLSHSDTYSSYVQGYEVYGSCLLVHYQPAQRSITDVFDLSNTEKLKGKDLAMLSEEEKYYIGTCMTQAVLSNPTKATAFSVVEEGINTFYLDLNGDRVMEQITYEWSESDADTGIYLNNEQMQRNTDGMVYTISVVGTNATTSGYTLDTNLWAMSLDGKNIIVVAHVYGEAGGENQTPLAICYTLGADGLNWAGEIVANISECNIENGVLNVPAVMLEETDEGAARQWKMDETGKLVQIRDELK